MPLLTCPQCAADFKGRTGQVFCSRACAKTKTLPTKRCEHCGAEFRKNREYSYAVWNAQRFCSRTCMGAARPRSYRTCEQCGTSFAGRTGRFCTPRCYGDWIIASTPLQARSDGSFSPATKRVLLERACGVCQKCSSAENLEFDHVIPQAAGGEGVVDNGQVLCRDCHWEKSLAERTLMRTLLRAHYGLA